MKFHWTMPKGLAIHYEQELLQYRTAFAANNLQTAWQHLERAHILGQSWPREHNYVHWLMLKFGIYIKSRKEIIGQIPRLLAGGIKSFVGKIPEGNTGAANVPALKSMKIAEDLANLINKYKEN